MTPEEKAIVQQLYQYNKVLFLSSQTCNEITQINVYDYDSDYSGKKAAGFAGFGNAVNISRDTLNMGLERAIDVFIHEVGHTQTGAEDSAPEFRNYQTSLSAAIITKIFPLEKSIIDNGLAKGITFPRIRNVLKKLLWKIAVGDKIDIKAKNKEDMEVGDY